MGTCTFLIILIPCTLSAVYDGVPHHPKFGDSKLQAKIAVERQPYKPLQTYGTWALHAGQQSSRGNMGERREGRCQKPQLWEKLPQQLTIAHTTQICGKPGFVNPCAQGNISSYPEEGACFLPAAFLPTGPAGCHHGTIQPFTNSSLQF